VTTTLKIAVGTRIDHASIIKLVRAYIIDLSEFGALTFELRKSGDCPTEYACLNERQSMLLLTLIRNNDNVVAFKKRLVKKFFELVSTHALAKSSLASPLPRCEVDFIDPVIVASAWAVKRKTNLATTWSGRRRLS
jgi:phage regulator Rha-like protein